MQGDKEYKDLPIRERVEILHRLCHWRMELDDIADLLRVRTKSHHTHSATSLTPHTLTITHLTVTHSATSLTPHILHHHTPHCHTLSHLPHHHTPSPSHTSLSHSATSLTITHPHHHTQPPPSHLTVTQPPPHNPPHTTHPPHHTPHTTP